MKANEFDRKFDKSQSIIKHLDPSKSRHPNQEQKRISVNLPLWIIQPLDREAKRLGVPRQAIIRMWLAERLHASETV